MSSAPHAHGLQPLLHEGVVALHAPVQVWSGADGGIGAAPVDGVYVGDIRVLRGLRLTVDGAAGEHLLTTAPHAATAEFAMLFRALDGLGADPDVRGTMTRRVTAEGVEHRFVLRSRLAHELGVELIVELEPDLTPMSAVKEGVIPEAAISAARTNDGIVWSGGGVEARIAGAGWDVTLGDSVIRSSIGAGAIRMRRRLGVPAHGEASAEFVLRVRDERAVVRAAAPATIGRPASRPADDRLARWLHRALGDLDALQLETSEAPGETFLAAGAPWFLTLFGRDAIWAARMLLPLDTRIAGGTLRVLAALQGTRDDPGSAEQPGKILHELRRDELALPSQGIRLPPRYYGTIDATPLWVSLLADARRAGLPDGEVRALTPNLRAALAWMRDAGDSDGDGLLEYVDTTGRGLANQGWKDSGDSVQWRDGRPAAGPIALCEVQAYAHRAALDGAELLDAFGDPGEGDAWRAWAEALARRFRAAFWIDDPAGAYPAIALDAHKRPVDTVTSNIGHLLGTGLLNRDEATLVAQRLVSPELASGYGLRTLSTDAAGYWPLSYHGGSVWTHDTAIAITGLAAEGFGDEAADLAEGLLRAAVAFDYRMPELYGGDPATTTPAPTPYPAACRPQAWSAAAAVAVWAALERVE